MENQHDRDKPRHHLLPEATWSAGRPGLRFTCRWPRRQGRT